MAVLGFICLVVFLLILTAGFLLVFAVDSATGDKREVKLITYLLLFGVIICGWYFVIDIAPFEITLPQ